MTPHPPLTLPTRLFLFEGKLFLKSKSKFTQRGEDMVKKNLNQI
jgi:hypothetical protein